MANDLAPHVSRLNTTQLGSVVGGRTRNKA